MISMWFNPTYIHPKQYFSCSEATKRLVYSTIKWINFLKINNIRKVITIIATLKQQFTSICPYIAICCIATANIRDNLQTYIAPLINEYSCNNHITQWFHYSNAHVPFHWLDTHSHFICTVIDVIHLLVIWS